MSRMKPGIISGSILSSLNKIKSAPEENISGKTIVNDMLNITVNAAIDSTKMAAELSGRRDLAKDIEAEGRIICQDIVNDAGSQRDSVIKKMAKAVKNHVYAALGFSEARFGPQQALRAFGGPVAGFFRDQIRKSPTVGILSAVGKLIGEKFPIPMGSLIGESLGCLAGTVTERLVNTFGLGNSYKKLIVKTEFCRDNIQMLYDYGIKEEKFALLGLKFAEEVGIHDEILDELIEVSKIASVNMHDAIDDV